MSAVPDWLAKCGITRISDNLDGGSLQADAVLLARLLGAELLDQKQQKEGKANEKTSDLGRQYGAGNG